MNAKHRTPPRSTLVSFLLVGLVASACGPAAQPTAAVRPTVAHPAQAVVAPTHAPAVNAPTKPQPSTQPTTKPNPTIAPTQKPAPTTAPTAKSIPFGTAQTTGDLSIVPSKFEMLTKSGQSTPKVGNEYLLVTVSVENTSKSASLALNPAQLVLVDPSAQDFLMVNLTSLANELKAQTLKPGQKIEGVVAYEVPAKLEKWSLEFQGADKNALYWSLPSTAGSARTPRPLS